MFDLSPGWLLIIGIGGAVLLLLNVIFIATVWHAAYHAGEWFARENERHRATEHRGPSSVSRAPD